MKPTIVYRAFHHDDDELWRSIGKYGYDPKIRSELGGIMSSDDSTYWIVAMSDSVVAGFAALKEGKRMLSHLYVFPEFRQRGIAGELIELRIKLARSLRLPYLKVAVKPNRIKHYEGLGFTELYTRGKWHWMRLDL